MIDINDIDIDDDIFDGDDDFLDIEDEALYNFEEDNIVLLQAGKKKLERSFSSKEHVFDPRIVGEKESTRQKWSSKSVELANNGLISGYKLKESPYLKYVKDVNLRKARLSFNYTEDEQFFMMQCIQDKILFANNFISLKQEDLGWQPITLRDYQVKTLNYYDTERWNLLMFPRQSGKTTTTVVEIVHFCTFNVDKDCVVIAQSELVVGEILKKIKEAFASLPFFMQPGFVSFTKDGFILDNGCRLKIGIASESVVQGFSLDLLFIDEFAYIPASRVNKFWNNIYPSLVNNPNSRCIIASTPNGRNKFYELWIAAEQKLNKFKTSRIYWWEVPGRDDQFKQDTIANVGMEGWEMGFECSFDTQLKSIFSVPTQKSMREQQRLFETEWNIDNHTLGAKYNISFVNQDKIPYDVKTDYFTLTIDISEGLELDYSIIKIRKLFWDTKNKFIKFLTVGVYRDNMLSVEDLAQLTLDLSREFDQNKIKFIVENNQYGGEFFAHIDNMILNDIDYNNIDTYIFARFYRSSRSDYERGIRWDKGNKKVAVRQFKGLIDNNIFEETHWQSIEEYLNFGKQKNDTYAAQYGHDDLVMVDVSLAAFIKQNTTYSNEFLLSAETDLRYINKDFTDEYIETQKQIEKQKRSEHSINGYIMRNYKFNVNDTTRLRRVKREQQQQIKKNQAIDYFDDVVDNKGNFLRKKRNTTR